MKWINQATWFFLTVKIISFIFNVNSQSLYYVHKEVLPNFVRLSICLTVMWLLNNTHALYYKDINYSNKHDQKVGILTLFQVKFWGKTIYKLKT